MKCVKSISIILCCCVFVVACDGKFAQPDDIDHSAGVVTSDDPDYDFEYSIYEIGSIHVETSQRRAISSKTDYVDCNVEVDGGLFMGKYTGPARIRGRGNSTWWWYPKKPYRLKLEESASLMGMYKNKDWVLLADYRDPTHMMNMTAFAMAHYLEMPFTNHYRYVRLTVNGQYLGLYMITEHIERAGHRIKVDKDEGYIFNLDLDDGPVGSPDSGDNFWSEIYSTEVGIKYPDNPTPGQIATARESFAQMERAVKSRNWQLIQQQLDVRSAVNEMLIQEITQNIDFCNRVSFHSVPIYKVDNNSPWAWGPVWDFDSGYSLDVNNHMRQGFFVEYKKLILGSDPYAGTSCYCGGIPPILRDLFSVPEFVRLFKEIWADNKDGMLNFTLNEIDQIQAVIREAAYEDYDIWGISAYMDFDSQVETMKQWLLKRIAYLDTIIPNYPER